VEREPTTEKIITEVEALKPQRSFLRVQEFVAEY